MNLEQTNRFDLLKIDQSYTQPQGTGTRKWKILSLQQAREDSNKLDYLK